MKRLWKKILLFAASCSTLAACQDLDIPPRNILSGSDIYNEGGITAYMAGLYNHLPMEDFNMGDDGGRGGFFNWNAEKTTMGSTGEFANNQMGNNCIYGDKGYWKPAYQIIRQANSLILDLPNYFPEGAEEWIAEARFLRAYTYFALVKRYGGVPLLTEPQALDADLILPRSSHQECVDFILEDLDYAMTHMTSKKTNGRANKYVAAALKSRVALYAGSIARYGEAFMYKGESGTQLCGIPADLANDYFQQAYAAAVAVDEGGYSLHTGGDKRQAFREVFTKAATSSESIFIREYDIKNYVHSWDRLMAPDRMTNGNYGGRHFVPLDWVELFDGLPLDPATGHLNTLDADGNYIVYDNGHALYDNAEPRLLASIMVPGDTYYGLELDMRNGLIIDAGSDAKIKKITVDDGKTTYSQDKILELFKKNGVTVVRSTKKPREAEVYQDTGVAINGLDGPATSNGNICTTGFYGAKWMAYETAVPSLHMSTQPWIDIRYAEVLLNRAEAAVELAQNGVATYEGANLLDDAMKCINRVRERAGADLLTSASQLGDTSGAVTEHHTGKNSFVFAPNAGLHIVRVERYKELAVEHKLYWDLRRWFTAHEQMYQVRWRMLAPYMFLEGATVDKASGIPYGKYIFDVRTTVHYNGQHTFDSKYYYEKIPDTERSVNYLLEQNNRY